MKTKLGRDARLLALFAILAALPLALWACADAGDEPGSPTGPSTKYNPNMNYPGATITVTNPSTVSPGGEFTIVATFKDANGLPVEGVPLQIWAENGSADAYFDYETNATLTGPTGKASIGVIVSAGCPAGSYTLVVATGPVSGPQARGYAHVEVSGTGVPAVTGVAITSGATTLDVGAFSTYRASVTANCTYVLEFDFGSGWVTDVANNRAEDYSWSAAGSYSVVARARCTSPVTEWVESTPYDVTVVAP